MSEAVETLLSRIVANPSCAIRAISDALGGPNAREVGEALRTDIRFGPPLRLAIRDHKALREGKWLVQFLGKLGYAPSVPELLAVWRARIDGLSDQAGRAVLAIGERRGLEAIAADIADAPDPRVALRAVFLIDSPSASFDRLAPICARNSKLAPVILFHVSSNDGIVAAEPRWTELAMRCFRGGDSRTVEAARELLRRRVPKVELERLFPASPPAMPPDPDSRMEALEAARARMAKLRDALPESMWITPPKTRSRQLAALEKIVGPLPAVARAFYEQIDGIDVPTSAPRDRFVVYPLAQATKAARRWARTNDSIPVALRSPFEFPVAPDGYAKAGSSGGPDIGFAVPWQEDDPPLQPLRGSPRFSTFVRRALKKAKQAGSKR